MHKRNRNPRLGAILLLFTASFALIFLRLFYVQVIDSAFRLSKLAANQHALTIELSPERGRIFDRNLNVLAVSRNVYSVYAVPRDMTQREKAIAMRTLASCLGLKGNYLSERLNKDKLFVWIAREVPDEKAKPLIALKLKGLGFVKEPKRFYPDGTLASHVLGFVGRDDKGLEGLELLYDKYLKGVKGVRVLEKDAKRRMIYRFESKHVLPKDGCDLVLTIDETIQHIVERELDKAMKEFHPKGASVIVMSPQTGEILAIANRPAFNSNSPSGAPIDARRNRAITDSFEPGSTFKIVTASAALESNILRENDKVFCENGAYFVAGHTLHDHKPHGWLTFREVIEKSSNIGTCKVAMKLGGERLYKAICLFGFGKRTNIDLPGEISGVVKPTSRWSKTTITAVPMGQEVTVSAMQLACAVSAIANGGLLVKPHIVKAIQDREGVPIKFAKPSYLRRVISAQVASKMREFLAGVVEEGTGQMAKLPSYTAAGKTGTAQKITPDGRYSHTDFVASFVGFAPAEDPRLAIVVVLDNPHPYYYGGVVAAPVFKRIAVETLRYLGVLPNEMIEARLEKKGGA